MSDVIHATERALAIVRWRGDLERSARPARADTRACDGAHATFSEPTFYATAALMLLDGKDVATEALLDSGLGIGLPTCQRCRVLLDAALENPREVAP